jgi:hypothetical protein
MARNQPQPKPVPERAKYEIIDPVATDFVFRVPGEPKARTHYIGPDDPRRAEGIEMFVVEADYYREQGALVPFGSKPKGAKAELARETAAGENPTEEKPKHRK